MQKELGTSTQQDLGDDGGTPLRVLPGGPAADAPPRESPPDDTGQAATPTTTTTAPGPIRPGFRLTPDRDDPSSTLIFSIDPQDDRIPLLPPVMSIGRDPENDIRIDSPETSRAHALLHYENGAWHVEDLNSTNGTHVNFQRAHAKRLEDGDILYIGGQLFQFRATGGEADSYLIKISLPGLAKPRLTTKPSHLRRSRPARPDRSTTDAGHTKATPEAVAEAPEPAPPQDAEDSTEATSTPDDTDEVVVPNLEAILPPRPESITRPPARHPWALWLAVTAMVGLLGSIGAWIYLDSNYSYEPPVQSPPAAPGKAVTLPVPDPSLGEATVIDTTAAKAAAPAKAPAVQPTPAEAPAAQSAPAEAPAARSAPAEAPAARSAPAQAEVSAPAAPTEPTEPSRQITALLQKARQQLAALRLTRPRGDNAADTYRAVLRLDPRNRVAQRGLRGIANRYLAMARRAYQQGEAARALRLVARGLSVQPRHRALRALQARLRDELASVAVPAGELGVDEVEVVESIPATEIEDIQPASIDQ